MLTKEFINMSLGEFVAKYPSSRKVFDQFNLDYCCGGAQTIHSAIKENKIEIDQLFNALKEHLETIKTREPHESIIWTDKTLTELANHIEENHHTFMKKKMPYVKMFLTKLEEVHGKRYSDTLTPLKQTFEKLKKEIEKHLWDEENVLFPYLKQLEASKQKGFTHPYEPAFTVNDVISLMEEEHDNAGEALRKMRMLTDNYTLPEDACKTWQLAYEELQAIEDDLHKHVHKENSILFPQVLNMIKTNQNGGCICTMK